MTDPLRILIVEDDAKLAASVEELLHADGRFLVVGSARSGDEAIALVEQESPDLVLMDIGMPGLNGIDATRAIRARDAGQHVVIYTGSDEYDDVSRADEAGAAGYLHKRALTSPDLADALLVLHENYVAGVPDPE
ncbi:MAG TPA: response regulator transcription factor [Gaiellaceae bacterium]|nr:response regulator transcription factor [Gaiellaceae bacterium]